MVRPHLRPPSSWTLRLDSANEVPLWRESQDHQSRTVRVGTSGQNLESTEVRAESSEPEQVRLCSMVAREYVSRLVAQFYLKPPQNTTLLQTYESALTLAAAS